ncbi:MAG: hypothetical protein ABI851_09195 [Saprospiraceae bacterium]
MRLTLFFLIVFSSVLFSQSNGYGIRFGSGISTQRWQGGSGRNPLTTYHADLILDSESGSGNVVYGALGYHLRGSSIRFNRFVDQFGNVYPGGSFAMKFHNIALEIGAKKKKSLQSWDLAYGLGLRAEVTAKAVLGIYTEYHDFINKFNYGFTVCGSAETKLNKYLRIGFEARVSPDISKQIHVPVGVPYYDPYTGTAQPGYEQSIKNLGLEASLYIRFLQIIQYIE